MSRVFWLYRGEVLRMSRYGIFLASLATTILWILTIQFSGLSEGIGFLFHLLLTADASLMSLLLTGVTMTFEKQEASLKSLLITPITKGEYLLAKLLGTVTSSLTTLILMLSYAVIVKDLEINILGIFAAVILVSLVFGQVGILLTFITKDFTHLLMTMLKFMLVFIIPFFIELTGWLEAKWLTIWQFVNPLKHTLVVFQASSMPVAEGELYGAIAYLLVLGLLLQVVIQNRFVAHAAMGGE